MTKVYTKWLLDLKKIGPSESSILVIQGKKNQLVEEKVTRDIEGSFIVYSKNRLPDKVCCQDETIIISNYTNKFTKEIGNHLLNNCPQNIIVFFQEGLLDNFDDEFLENYCTVISSQEITQP